VLNILSAAFDSWKQIVDFILSTYSFSNSLFIFCVFSFCCFNYACVLHNLKQISFLVVFIHPNSLFSQIRFNFSARLSYSVRIHF
jgi:hypothetical protein